MITAKEAIKIAEQASNGNKAVGIGETSSDFVVLLNNDGESYTTVNKDTKEIGQMWFWDFGDLVNQNKAQILEIERVS